MDWEPRARALARAVTDPHSRWHLPLAATPRHVFVPGPGGPPRGPGHRRQRTPRRTRARKNATVTGAPRSCQGPPGHAPARPPRAFLDLDAVLTAPRCARAWTREILWEWGAAELADAAELVARELVTNSLNACAGPGQAAIRLVLTLDRGELAILVRDDHPGVPMAAQRGADDEGGRGLLIVEYLSDRYGWYPLKDAEPAKVPGR